LIFQNSILVSTAPIAGDTFPQPTTSHPGATVTPAAPPAVAVPPIGQPVTVQPVVVQPRFIFGRHGSQFTCQYCQQTVRG